MTNRTINLLMPTYEPVVAHLHEAVDSVLSQTHADWTLLIHDDASKTDVELMIKSYLKDSRIRFIRSEKNLGIAGNWNACLSQADTPYVQFLFQDDRWEPEYLSRSLTALEADPSLVFTAAHHTYQNEDHVPFEIYDALQEWRLEYLSEGKENGHDFLIQWIRDGLHPNIIGEPSFVLMRTDACRKAGPFAKNLPQLLDIEYWTRLLMIGDWYYLAENLGTFRVHGKAASAQNQESGAGIFDRFLCLAKLSKTLPDADDRKLVGSVMREQSDLMAQKFLTRVRGGKQANMKSGTKIPMRYYPMLGLALVRSLLKNE